MNREILNIVNRVLSEEISGRLKNVKHKIFETDNMKGECCSECGSYSMTEGECTECGYGGAEMGEELHGNQGRIDKNKNNKIDSEDFKMLRSKRELDELGGMDDGHPRFGNRKLPKRMTDDEIERLLRGDDEEEMTSKDDDYPTKPGFIKKRMKQMSDNASRRHKDIDEDEAMYELDMNESTGDKLYFAESEMVDMIETIILEEKKKSKTKPKSKTTAIKLTKSNQDKSKKENDDYIGSVVKKMKDYLKGGSKGEYSMLPKHFPKGNGELAKMDKKAYIPSDAVGEYIANFTAAALENIDYDDIHPDESWVTDNIVGSSRTGNNPDWANAVETPNNKKRNQIRKDNLLSKLKRKAYNKSPQPIVKDRSGENTDKASRLMLKLESTEDKKVITDIEKMKNLFDYGKKTQ
jgi:ribosomal protein L37E